MNLLTIITVIFVTVCPLLVGPTMAVTYHVSSSIGNNGNDGLSPGAAWETIGKVNGELFQPGDFILFKRDDTWREELSIIWSGSSDAYITFGAYGLGAKPRILGSEQASGWTSVSGEENVWYSSTALNRPHAGHPGSIFFGEQDGSISWGRIQNYNNVNECGSDFSNLQQEYDWCYDGAIYVYSSEDPGTRYSYVEVPQRRGSITMKGHSPEEYIVIDGLELMHGTMYGYNDGWPMNYEVRGLIIKNCHIGYIGIQGGNSAMGLVIWHSDMLVQNNDIHDCGRRSISYNVYTDTSRTTSLLFENVLFENNILHNGFHTTGFDISHGNGVFDTFSNFIFRNNFIYDDPADNPADGVNDFNSMSLFLWPGNGLFTDFKIHHNVIKNPKQKGLAIGGVHNLQIYNNVIYGMNPNIGSYRPMVSISGDYQNLRFNNNIVYGTVSKASFPAYGIYMGGSEAGVTSMDNNIYYQVDPEQYIIYVSSQGYDMSEWSEYKSNTGWDQNSPVPQEPLFVDPSNDDFHLLPGSTAIDAGVDVGLEFEGDAPDIGAYESPASP